MVLDITIIQSRFVDAVIFPIKQHVRSEGSVTFFEEDSRFCSEETDLEASLHFLKYFL